MPGTFADWKTSFAALSVTVVPFKFWVVRDILEV